MGTLIIGQTVEQIPSSGKSFTKSLVADPYDFNQFQLAVKIRSTFIDTFE